MIRINLRHISFSSAAFGEREEIRGKVCGDTLRQSSALFLFIFFFLFQGKKEKKNGLLWFVLEYFSRDWCNL